MFLVKSILRFFKLLWQPLPNWPQKVLRHKKSYNIDQAREVSSELAAYKPSNAVLMT